MSASAAQTPAARLGARRAPTRAHRRVGCAPERTSAGRAAPSSAGPTRGRVAAAAGRAAAPPAPHASPLPRAPAASARVAPLRARARRDVTARVSAAAPGSAPTTPSAFPLDSAGVGWDAAELHALTGLAWTFTTPSSTDGRKIVKAASAIANRSLKGSSNWRKEDWEAAAKRADVRFLDTFSTLPGMRGFRACWAPNGVALLYVPGVRKFFSVNDVKDGVADARADAAAGGRRRRAREPLPRQEGVRGAVPRGVRRGSRDGGGAARRAGRRRASRERATLRGFAEVGADGRPVETTEATEASSGFADSSNGSLVDEARASYDAPLGAIARWCMGLGVDAAALHAEFGLGFDFHGPAGAVSRAVVAAGGGARRGRGGDERRSRRLLGQG
jgi:hypothetical protein